MVDLAELPSELRNRVEVLGVLGRGSFGQVFEVRVDGRPEPLALKLLSSEVDMQRVSRELEACGRVRHPHVLTVHGYGVDARCGWLLMERAEGTLFDLLRGRDPVRVAEAWEACRQVAAGLAALHSQGIVHRDLKPENVLMVGGQAKVGDLGLAKGGGLETLTATGLVMGTPAFMAPEQIRGEKVTPATDVFAFGVMLYRVATGRMPYSSSHVRDLIPVIMRGGPVAAGVPLGGCPEVVRSCLDPDPQRRPGAAELARSLGPPPEVERLPQDPKGATRVLTSPGLPRPSDPPLTPVKGVAARNVAVAGGRNVLWVIVVAGLVVGGLRSVRPAPDHPAPGTPLVSADPVEELAWPAALGEDFPAKVRADLTRAQETFLDREDAPHGLEEVEEGVPPGWRALLDPDPGRFRLVVRESEGLRRWYAWIGSGGAFWELSAAQQRELAAIDERFLGERQSPPFRPWLGLTPAEGPPETFHIEDDKGERVLSGEFTGWTATALQRVVAARAVVRKMQQEFRDYFDGLPSRFPGAELEPLGLQTVFHVEKSDADRFLWDMHIYGDHAEWRGVLAPWLEPLATELVALYAATRMACIHEPEAAVDLPYVVGEVLREFLAGRLSGYWGLEFDLLVGTADQGVLVDLLRGPAWDHYVRARGDMDIGRPEGFQERRAQLWAKPLVEGPGLVAIRSRPWFPWVVRFAIYHGALAHRPYPELAALRRRFIAPDTNLSPRGWVDLEGGLAYSAVTAGPPPGVPEARDLLARYRALDPAVLPTSADQFQDLTPRLEELTRVGP